MDVRAPAEREGGRGRQTAHISSTWYQTSFLFTMKQIKLDFAVITTVKVQKNKTLH